MRRRSRPDPEPAAGRGAAGLTLVEVLVAASLIAVVLGALLPLLSSGQLTWEHARRRTAMVQNARIGLDTLTRSLRAADVFESVTPDSLRFTYFFGDGSTPTVEYRLNAATNELEVRWVPEGFHPLAGPFEEMRLRCFDDAGDEIVDCADPAAVRSVEVMLRIADPDGVVAPISVTSRAFRQTP